MPTRRGLQRPSGVRDRALPCRQPLSAYCTVTRLPRACPAQQAGGWCKGVAHQSCRAIRPTRGLSSKNIHTATTSRHISARLSNTGGTSECSRRTTFSRVSRTLAYSGFTTSYLPRPQRTFGGRGVGQDFNKQTGFCSGSVYTGVAPIFCEAPRSS